MSQHRTPLRYPGGKQRLAPFIRELIAANNLQGGHYVEPYAGGAGIAIELLLDDTVSHIHLNDISVPVYAFWRSVVYHSEELCRLVMSASLNVEEWRKRKAIVQNPEGKEEVEVGFSTLYLNRCNRSGILGGGLIGGINQSGKWKMDARFSRSEITRRIQAIAAKARSISIRNDDAETFMRCYIPDLPENVLVYCDPPYFNLSSRLYLNRYKQDDHARVARVVQQSIQKKWVVSYDDAPEIKEYFKGRNSFYYQLQYNARSARIGREIFVCSDNIVLPSSSSLAYINDALVARSVIANV